MDMSSSVCMRTWALSSRAMQSSTPSFLPVSFKTHWGVHASASCGDVLLVRIVFACCGGGVGGVPLNYTTGGSDLMQVVVYGVHVYV